MTTRITAPRVRVVIEDAAGELTETLVQTDNRDAIRFDLIRSRKGWPGMQEAPMLWMTVLAWNAIKRSGGTTDDVETFLDKVVQITPVDQADQDTDLADESQAAVPLA